MPNVTFSGKENPQRSSWHQIWDFVNTLQMLLPLSHWTHGRVAETSLATARLEASVTSALGYTAICKWGSPVEGVVGLR